MGSNKQSTLPVLLTIDTGIIDDNGDFSSSSFNLFLKLSLRGKSTTFKKQIIHSSKDKSFISFLISSIIDVTFNSTFIGCNCSTTNGSIFSTFSCI